MRMANDRDGAGYWLPSEFLTDDDFLIDKENFANTHNYQLDFPTDFPSNFETRSSHLLQKFSATSASPQSTLSGLRSAGSPNGAVEDLIYLAAGEVAKLRLSRGRAMNSPSPQPRILPQFHKETKLPTPPVYPNPPPQSEKIGSRAVRGMGHAAWYPYRNYNHGGGGGGEAARKACAGTGVFLPQRYDTNSYSSCPRTRPGCPSSTLQGRSSSAQLCAMTKPSVYRFVESHSRPEIGVAFAPDHNSVLAQRHALFLLQRRRSFSSEMVEGRDHPRLPQEWSY